MLRRNLHPVYMTVRHTFCSGDFALRQCADTVLQQGTTLFRSYNNGLEVGKRNVNTPGNVATLAECLSKNLFNAGALNRCLSDIYARQLEVSNQVDIKEVFLGDSIEYYCKERVYKPVLALEQLYGCGFPRP